MLPTKIVIHFTFPPPLLLLRHPSFPSAPPPLPLFLSLVLLASILLYSSPSPFSANQEREKAYSDYIDESAAKYASNPQPVATVGGGKSSIPILGGISKLFG